MQERLEEEVDVNATPKRRDRLFTRLSKGFTHSSQVVPSYGEFRLGHGDPLMKATLEYERMQATGNANMTPRISHTKKLTERTFDVYVDKEVHLKQHGSPLGGVGISDVVHFDDTTALAIPCIPLFDQSMIEESKE
ncbi:unnamed protein product [Cylindrotheca closterium]|uniref:Uncharacterized protein n=1 Tax=Cylindrotheca closterium TaxID=2856 RepID=A0AAD2CXJ8_9STRA|nr:unnamed protein product [Cylindrotheca closterium]